MSRREDNIFDSYEFDNNEEYLLAATYTSLQRQHIQNQLSMYVQQKLHISAEDYSQPEVFIRNQEYHRGLIDAMKFLLELDSSLQAARIEAIKDVEQKQQSEDSRWSGFGDNNEREEF